MNGGGGGRQFHQNVRCHDEFKLKDHSSIQGLSINAQERVNMAQLRQKWHLKNLQGESVTGLTFHVHVPGTSNRVRMYAKKRHWNIFAAQ